MVLLHTSQAHKALIDVPSPWRLASAITAAIDWAPLTWHLAIPGTLTRPPSSMLKRVLKASIIGCIFQAKTLRLREVKGAARSHTKLEFKTGWFDFEAKALLYTSGFQSKVLIFPSAQVPWFWGQASWDIMCQEYPFNKDFTYWSLSEYLLCARPSTSFH